MLNYKKIGKIICEERKKRGFTQEELASKIYVTRQAISKWECGKSIPDYDSLLILCFIFNLNPNEILNSKKEM